jgi:ribosomal protein L11 methyltransferase
MRTDYQPFTIGRRFIVHPPEINVPASGRTPICMDRGAFGSGEHETTRSCIEILEQLVTAESPKRILDLGSGTAILSIAALQLGADHVWCVDIEATAVASARRNLQLNRLDDHASHFCGTLDQLHAADFELILANIYGDILLDIAADLVSRAVAGGYLLLSGILWEYRFDVKKKYQELGCHLIQGHLLDDYCTLLLQKSA